MSSKSRVVPVSVKEVSFPANKPFLKDIDSSAGPSFSVSETAKFFFARSPHWIRLLERDGHFESRRTHQGVRTYNLSDVERMARALAKKGLIDGEQLQHALQLVYSEAKLWGHLGNGKVT